MVCSYKLTRRNKRSKIELSSLRVRQSSITTNFKSQSSKHPTKTATAKN